MSDPEFLRATNPQGLYLSLSHSQLRANCLAADKLLRERIEETEIATGFGKAAEDHMLALDGILRGALSKLELISSSASALEAGQDAQNTPGVARGLGPVDDAATVAIKNQISARRESQADAERYNQRVHEIAAGYGDVGTKTALVPAGSERERTAVDDCEGHPVNGAHAPRFEDQNRKLKNVRGHFASAA